MATIATVASDLRNRILAESDTAFYSTSTLEDMVLDASREVAGALRFPTNTVTGTLTAGSTTLTFSWATDIESLSVNGVSVERVSRGLVESLKTLPSSAFVRGFYADARGLGSNTSTPDLDVVLAPSLTSNGSYVALVVEDPYKLTAVPNTTEIWKGLFPQFHDLAALRAAVKAFQQGFEFDNAQFYLGRYKDMLNDLASYVGVRVVSNDVVGAG